MYAGKRCILLVDDEPGLLRALKELLSVNGYHVLTAGNGKDALKVFDRQAEWIDLVLTDVMMPELDGLGVLREIRAAAPAMPVILLTALGTEYDQVQGFQTGADDYVAKPFSITLLMARIEAVLRRSRRDVPRALEAGGIVLTPAYRTVEAGGQPVELTRREFDLLRCFLCNQGRVLSREQLVSQVWGFDFEGDERTVDSHVKNLRLKLGTYGGYIRTVYRVGYKFEAKG